ncbi:lysoplasmalogenase [Dyadobacter sp. NIV53]|uniref:lysoplasmalogenase n=1 Tax=Dyadobacter sp. NIV53 TaxID=2861765 RepID=UPI0021064FCD|nr:lysoplasmalogenase [Dyadobacter sp. NIV53]
MNTKLIFSIFFIIISLTEIIADLSGNKILIYLTKPLIMVSVIIYSFQTKTQRKVRGLLFFNAGLFFALFGDIFLMIQEEDLFIPGLASFLSMQILYAYAFYLDNPLKLTSKFAYIRLAPFLLFAITFYIILQPYLTGIVIKIAVAIYALGIASMAWMSFLRKNKVSNGSFLMVVNGAILFLISDSVIAVDKFITAIPLNTVWVMSTYCFAQYLIAIGYLKTKQTGSHPSVSF